MKSINITSTINVLLGKIIFLTLATHFTINTALASQIMDFKSTQKFADFSAATYASDSAARDTFTRYEYTLEHIETIPLAQVRYLIANHNGQKIQIIAIRGTSNIENAYVDFDFKMLADTTLGIKLHKGFAASAKEIYQHIKPILDKNTHYELTGHSLGGALAVILGMYLDKDGYKVDQIVTFGQPKVTNVFGARKFSHLPLIRVVTPDDLVPLVPPLDPLDLLSLDIYWHIGREIILFPENIYAELEGTESMMRAIGMVQDTLTNTNMLSEKNIVHHLMTTYMDHVKLKISDAKLLSFESAKKYFKSITIPGQNQQQSGRVLSL